MAVTEFADVFPGWNVWAVYQSKDLDFGLQWVGVSRDDRLRIWVEDELRLNAPGAEVADPYAFKGSQIQILPGPPRGLDIFSRKEDVPGPAMTIDSPVEVRYVRFFNRGPEARLVWPHDKGDKNYLLNVVYKPSASAPVTQGPGPATTTSDLGDAAKRPVLDTVVQIAPWLAVVGVAYLVIRSDRG